MKDTWSTIIVRSIWNGVLNAMYVMTGLLFFGLALPTYRGWVRSYEYDLSAIAGWFFTLLAIGVLFGIGSAWPKLLDLRAKRRSELSADDERTADVSGNARRTRFPYTVLRVGFTLFKGCCVVLFCMFTVDISHPITQSEQSAAIGNLRTVLGAELNYRSKKGKFVTFEELTDAIPPFLDGRWKDTVKNGYLISLQVGEDGQSFKATAITAIKGRRERTGIFTSVPMRSFFLDESGVIRWAVGEGVANENSTPIGE